MTAAQKKPWYRWVLIAIAAGIAVGWLWPSVGAGLEPFGTTFIAATKMVIAPVVFLTIVSGIAGTHALADLDPLCADDSLSSRRLLVRVGAALAEEITR